jgi:hypothetical protein
LHAFFRSLPADRFPALAASASTSGPATATSDSPPASTRSSAGSTGPVPAGRSARTLTRTRRQTPPGHVTAGPGSAFAEGRIAVRQCAMRPAGQRPKVASASCAQGSSREHAVIPALSQGGHPVWAGGRAPPWRPLTRLAGSRCRPRPGNCGWLGWRTAIAAAGIARAGHGRASGVVFLVRTG